MASGYYLQDNYNVTPQWGSPRRGGGSFSGTIIVHTAECAIDHHGEDLSAENTANFIRTRADYGSYHRLVDSDSILRLVHFDNEAWQDSETNPWAVGISAAVQAGAWNTIESGRRDRIYRNLARCGAEAVRHAKTKGINVPIKRINGDAARWGNPGFCAHGDSGKFRSDPGVQFDWNLFLRYVAEELGQKAPSASTPKPAITPAGTAVIRVTHPVAKVRTGPGTNFPLVKHLPEGVAKGAPLAILGYVKGQDPYKTGDDAWLVTEGNFYVWANTVGNSIAGLKYLGDKTPKAPASKPTAVKKPAPAPVKKPVAKPAQANTGALRNTDKQWVFAPGETMSDAAKYFNTTVAALAKFNGIKDPNKIRVGENVWPPIPGAGLWVVDPGDTLSKIAAYYGRSVADVKKANGLTSDRIKVGQRIIVL